MLLLSGNYYCDYSCVEALVAYRNYLLNRVTAVLKWLSTEIIIIIFENMWNHSVFAFKEYAG